MTKRLFGDDAPARWCSRSASSACGGGGGGGVTPIPPAPASPTPTPTPTPTPDAHSDTRHRPRRRRRLRPTTTRPSISASNYAVAANAIAAYNAGATGKGVKIGIVDSGINPSLAEFAGRIDPASGDVAGNRGVSDEGGHGTAVSRGRRRGAQQLGHDGRRLQRDDRQRARRRRRAAARPTDGCSFFDPAIAAGIDAARMAGAKVINLSLGGSAPGTDAARRDAARGERRHRARHFGRQ